MDVATLAEEKHLTNLAQFRELSSPILPWARGGLTERLAGLAPSPMLRTVLSFTLHHEVNQNLISVCAFHLT